MTLDTRSIVLLFILFFMWNTVYPTDPMEEIRHGIDELLAFIELLLLTLLYLLMITVVMITFIKYEKVRSPEFGRTVYVGALVIGSIIFIAFVSVPVDNIWYKSAVFVIAFLSGFFPMFSLVMVGYVGSMFRRKLLNWVLYGISVGGIVAGISFLFNENVYIVLSGVGAQWLFILMVAPVIEESAKLVGTVKLIQKTESSCLAAATVIGGTFAALENLVYFTINTNPFQTQLNIWVNIMLNRTFVTATAHGLFTSVAAYGWLKKGMHRAMYMSSAILLHILFNGLGMYLSGIHGKEILTFVMALVYFLYLYRINKKGVTQTSSLG